MNNKITCPGCGHENDLFRSNCTECGFLLRDKVPNIDLWLTFWNIFYNPAETLKKIIRAEHKNFLAVFIILFSIKLYVDQIIFSSIANKSPASFSLLTLIFIIAAITGFSILISFLTVTVSRLVKSETRWKDNLAVICYSQLPLIISLLIILPSAYAMFGKYIVSTNPYIHEIKPAGAYLLYFLEAVCYLWNLWLLFYSFLIQTGRKLPALLISLLFIAGSRFIVSLLY